MIEIPTCLQQDINKHNELSKKVNDKLKELYLGKIVIRKRGKFKGRQCKIDYVYLEGKTVLFLARPIRLRTGVDGDDSELLNCVESRTYCEAQDLENIN